MGRTMVLYNRLVVLVSMFFLILASVVSLQLAVCVTFLTCCSPLSLYMVQCGAQVGVVFNCIEWGVIEK